MPVNIGKGVSLGSGVSRSYAVGRGGVHDPGDDFLASLPGYAGNWDTSDDSFLSLTGNNIDTFIDQSPAGNDIVYTSGARATNLGTIGSLQAAQLSTNSNKTHTGPVISMPEAGAVFVVAILDSLSVARGIVGARTGGTGPGWGLDIRGSNALTGFLWDDTGQHFHTTSLSITLGQPFVAAMNWDATNAKKWVGLSSETQAHGLSLPPSGTTTLTVMALNTASSFTWGPGDWGQALFYNQGQTDAAMEAAIQVLAAKWGVSL